MKMRLTALILLLPMLLAFAAPALAQSAEPVYVEARRDAEVYAGPAASAEKLGTLAQEIPVMKLGQSDSWTIIHFEGKTGYVRTTLLQTIAEVGQTLLSPPVVYKATGNVNVRSGPGTGYKRLGKLKKGQEVVLVEREGDWAVIEYKDGEAYVSGEYIREETPLAFQGGAYGKNENSKDALRLEIKMSKDIYGKGEAIDGYALLTYTGGKSRLRVYGDEVLFMAKVLGIDKMHTPMRFR